MKRRGGREGEDRHSLKADDDPQPRRGKKWGDGNEEVTEIVVRGRNCCCWKKRDRKWGDFEGKMREEEKQKKTIFALPLFLFLDKFKWGKNVKMKGRKWRKIG